MARIDLKKTTISFIDGSTPTPVKLKIKIGDGNLTYNVRRQFKYVKDRGLLDTVRKDEAQPIDVRFDLTYEHITQPVGFTPITPEDFLKNINSGASLVTAGADPCEPFAVIIEVLQDQACAGVAVERITIPEFRYDSISHDLRAGTISVVGKAKVETPTITRS